ncbi:PLxRFG domain-containing protein [Pseudomonas paralcaligenes]|uniref:PLxRFG domain-containing protein n=1 Tax=Pseudomonas paralcaligenes TaxID=2772558 RepID=UPI0021D0F911|nr:PLxRFG domain-containing protein [Pseudomonas paralcaligenes]
MADLFDEFGVEDTATGQRTKAPDLYDEFSLGAAKPASTEGRGFLGHARDLGLSLAKSVVAVPEAAVGLADIPTGGAVGKALENQDGLIGFRPKETKDFLSDFHTDQYKEQQRQFQDADGVIEKTGVALTNPSMIINTVAESAAPMLAGGAVARGITAVSKAAPLVAGAIGEGSVMAGSQAESIRQQTEDGLLSAGQSLASLGTGLVGGLFGFAGGQLAKKLGIGDVDTMLASGVTPHHVAADLAQTPAKNLPRQVIEGAIVEGFLEELPQSVSEQIIQNLALNKPWHEGVEDAAVMGTLAGMAMGGAGAGYAGAVRSGAQDQQDQQATAEPDATFETVPEPEQAAPALAGLLPAPVYQASADGEVLTSSDQNTITQAQRQSEIDRLDRIRRGEVVDVTPIPQAPKLSEQLGLDPSAGPMSSAAALAVDSGATQQLHQQAALQEAAKAAEQGSKGAEQVDQETGEITQAQGDLLAADPATELQTRLEYVRQQARAGGWDARLVAERDRLVAELDKLQPLPVAATADQQDVEQSTAPTDLQAGIEQAQANAAAAEAPADIRAVVAKQIPQMTDAELQQAIDHYGPDHKRTAKLQKELAKRGNQSEQEANAGEAQRPAEAQTEEQPAQAAPAPEAAPAEAAPAVDAAARWDAMTAAERKVVADQAGIKGVLAKNLVKAPWERVGPSVRDKLVPRMAQPLTYEKAKADADAARARSAEASKAMEAFPRGATGLTPDDVKATPEWKAAKAESDAALVAEQNANAVVVKNFPKENRADIQAARERRANAAPAVERTDGTTEVLSEGMNIVHGSGNPNLKAGDIQIVRANGQKQGKAGRVYGGFYGTSEADSAQAEGYAGMMGGTPTLYDVKVKPGTKVLNKTGDITRLSEAYINELVSQGYGVVTGKDPRGRTEHVVIDKNAVESMAARRKPAEQQAPSIEGKDIGDGWAEFSRESGTAGIPRADMPQIKAEHRGAMVNFMNARGVSHQEQTVPAASLKPAQAEFSREKVARAKSFEGGSRSILVSSDGHVLDGHHQWLAARDGGEDVKVIRLDAPIRELVDLAREFPSSTVDDSSAEAPASTPARARTMEEAQEAVAAYFDWYIGKNPAAERPMAGLYRGNTFTLDAGGAPFTKDGQVMVNGDRDLRFNYTMLWTAAKKRADGQPAQQKASAPGEAASEAPAASRPGLPPLVSVGPSGFEPTPIGGKLYREMSPQNLADALRMHNQGNVSSAFFTDNIDLALGQGENRGVMVQYRGEAVSGSQHQKPGITERTGREYRADYVGADAIDQVLLPGGVRLGVLAKNMLVRHFDRAELEEGRILYTRKGVDVGAPLHELLATGTQQPVPAEQAPRGVLAKKAETEGEATEFPLKAAAASYSGISHSGTDRAKSDAQEFQTYIDVARDAGLALAHTDAQKAAVEQAAGELRAEYLRQYGRLMNVRSSTYSGFVAGRSRLNARQADQRNSAYNRAIDTFVAWQKANEDRVRRAALDARTPEQVQADQQAVETARRENAELKDAKDLDLMRSILSWKKGGEPVEIARGALLAGVNKGRDGYPSSIKLQPADGGTLVDDKFDLATLFRERGMSVPESKRRVRELVDAVRAEDAAQALATPAAAPHAEASAVPAAASKTPRLDAHVDLMKRVRSGEATADEYKAAFAHADGNQEALAAELNTMKKDELLRSGGYSFFHRYRNDNKANIVQALVNRIIDEYALGRRYGSSSFVMSAAGLAAHRQAQDLALRELVANTTEEDIKAHAAEVAAERKDLQDRREAQQKAIANPQTLAEFRQAVSYNMEAHGETRQQAFMRLTPEQRIRYDELEADSTKAQREQAKVQAKTQVASAGQTTASEVIETKHTKHGHDLFVIQLDERVGREDYDTLNSSAKRLGGSYSSYRGNGAVPGFQFRTRDAAEAFRKLVVGDTADAQAIAEARRDAFEDDRSQSAVERLRTMAQALDERAEESLGRERKQNTDRRARMAASAEAAARADKALAATMSNLAQAIEDGRAKFLDTVRQKVQVEFLGRELRNAKDAQIRATSPSYADQEKRKGEPVDAETVDYATFPTYTAMRSDLASLARQMVDVDGLKKLGARLEKVADDVTEAYTEWAKQNLLSVSRFTRGDQLADFKGREDAERAIRRSGLSGKAIVLPVKRGLNRIIMAPSEAMKQGLWQGDGDKRITLAGEFGRELVQALGRRSGSRINLPWALESAHEKRKRLEGMGILTGSEYRSALREFAALREAPAAPDKIKEMERAMIGRRNDGLDFFPTSDAVVGAMLDAAEIDEGMSVLEPSAGMGHIADAIREQAGVEPDVVELSGERRELLEAKGYRVAGSDFMEMQPRGSFTFGDVFRAPDGTLGVMRGQGGMGSNRVRLQPLDENGMPDDRRSQYVDRDDLVGVEHRGADSGYDRIVMNPPFSKGRDIQHVQHAYSLLRPGGRLVAIMGEGAFFQSNSRAESFRAWLDGVGGTSESLPEGSFMDPALPVNTGVNARLVVIDKPLADEASPSQPDEQPTVQYSFAGRNAQGADRLALETARQRIAMGEDAEAVRQDTGWHRGADGRWRFEVSDDQARIAVAGANAASIIANAEIRALEDGRTGATVGDVLDHQQLFAAYPSLRDLPLRLMPADSSALARLQRRPVGFAVQMQGSIPRDEVASPLIHELQHAIQNIEGFALGGSRRMFASDLDATGAETYRRLAGEVEARNVQMRMRMTPGLRQAIAPEATADVPSGEVLVTFNGTDLVGAPQPQNITGRPPMTAQGLVRAFDLQFPKLTKAVRTMLQRGQEGKRGGLVFIDSPDPLRIAGVFSRKTGTSLSASVQLFEDKGRIQGFYDAKSGLTFLVGPNLDPVTGPAVLLHEMTHGQQREKIDRQASNMLMNRASAKSADLRAFLDRVAARMVDAGETANPREAAAYIVEQAVIEGREQGFGEADSRFLGWVDQAIGKPVGDFLRSVLAMVRQWMLRHGMPIGQITVSDLVDYAMAGVEQAAAGNVRGEGLSLSQDDLQKARILQGPPVSVLRGDEAPRGMAAVREWATQLFKEQGGLANNPDLGAVVLDGRAVRDSLGHGKPNPYKYAAFAAVKEVLERGALVHQASYKGGESFYVSAPVVIDGMDDIVTVLVRREPSMQRMYLHSVATKGYLLSRRGSGADADAAEQRTGSSGSEDVASVLQRLLTATLDSGPGDGPQFSRSGLREIAGKATLELNRTFTAPGKLSWWHKTIGTMYNLAERSPFFKPVFESAQGFIDDVSHYAADAAEHAPKLLPKLETWRDIAKSPVSATDNKAVAKPVFEGTLMWARDVDGQPVRVESLAERAAKLTADQKAEILLATGKIPPGMLNAWRALSPEQFGKMVDSRYEAQVLKAGIVWTDAELRSIFKLTDQQVALYREFRAATDRSLDTMARADMLRFAGDDAKELRDDVMDAPDVHIAARVLRDHLARRADDWPDRATHLLNLAHGVTERAERVAQLQAEGYAPLSRFGKYTVDVVDQDGERQYFSLFESKREANLMAEQMKVAFPGANISQGTLSEEAYKLFAGITPETLELFGNALGFDSQGDSAQNQAFQEYLRLTKTNRSAMRRLIHRKGIAGYSEDVGRVLASFVYSNARQTAAGLHLGDLAEAVDAIPQQQGELKDAAVRLAEYIRNPQEEAQAVRGLLFAQYLGGSVASAFVNMTQPVAVSFPWLSQYGGAGKAAAALGRAAKHMSTKGYQYEADLAKALKVAEDDGVVSPQEVHQLMAQARGSGSLRAGDGTRAGEARAMASNAVSRLSVAWGKLFGAAEQVNRRVTFIAAYRLAKEQGMPDPAAFARRAVTETQFVYSKASKMQWGRGAVGGTLMTFKTYSVAYLELMHRLWNQGEPGSQERKDGRKAAMLMIATLMLMSGVGGLPFGEDAEDLIDGAAQLMGYNFSAQKAKQQFLDDVFGQGLAGFIEKGVTGLPGMPLDVSGRLGMGNLIPGTGLLQERTDHTRDVLEIAGPAGDMASRFVSGGRKILGGDIGAGLLEMSPTAVRNAAKGVDMAATGMYRDTKGYKVLETSHLEAAMKAIGFQPASVAQVQEANWLNQRAKAFYSLRAQEIRAQWAAGIFERDQGKVAAARQQIADWNARNPDQPMIIRVPDIMRRVREMSKSKDQRIADTAPRAMRAAMREELARSRE